MTTPEMKPLLPCPFCGGDPFFPEIDDPDEDFAWMIRCRQCGCQLDGFQDEAAARGGWDSRNSPTPAKEPSGELEKAVEVLFKAAEAEVEADLCRRNKIDAKDFIQKYGADAVTIQQRSMEYLEYAVRAYRAQVTKEGDEHVS